MFRGVVLGFGLVLAGCQMEDSGVGSAGQADLPEAQGQCLVRTPAYQAAPFNACSGAGRVQLALVGDVLLHRQLQMAGYARGFRRTWYQAEPLLSGADIAIANLEGPVARGLVAGGRAVQDPGPVFGTGVYTGYPAFNYHPVVLPDLKSSGIDIVTTANNHAMDRRSRGVDMTLEELDRVGIKHVGTIRAGAAREFVLRERTRLGVISFIACSFSTNGIADPAHQVLGCYGADRQVLLDLVRREAADRAVAGVIVLPHWGQEYTSRPDGQQQALARDLVAAGATAVVGTHPHAVQPWTLNARADGAQVPVVFSTGNFVAVQTGIPAQVGAMAMLELCRGKGGQGLVAHQGGWVAMQMEFTPQAYWLDVAPAGATGRRAMSFDHLSRVAPGFSAQPQDCR